MITRIAPTPSGYPHLGNAVNAQLIAWLALALGGTIALRIDDMDAGRYRREYLDDIFHLLRWLDITWTIGPSNRQEVESTFSMGRRTPYFRKELEAAIERGLEAYACGCSRADISGPAVGGCPGGCRARRLALEPGRTALRVHVPLGTCVAVGDDVVRVDLTAGDFVVWRRDDLPAYHLVSVIEDRDLGTTHVVRGEDLRDSAAAQVLLAGYLEAANLVDAAYVHHGLVTRPDGTKLSKSQLVTGRPLDRTSHMRHRIHDVAVDMGEPIGIRPPG